MSSLSLVVALEWSAETELSWQGSPWSSSGSLCAFPMCTFRPRLESDEKLHWSHLKGFLNSVFWEAEALSEAAACCFISLLGGRPFSSTRRWWKARRSSNLLFLFPLLFFFFFFFNSPAGGVEVEEAEDVVHCSVAVILPSLCFRKSEHYSPCFTIASQHESSEGFTWARVTPKESWPDIFASIVYLN